MISSGLNKSQRDMVRASHKRSLDFGVERERVQPVIHVQGIELERKLERNKRLLTIATPFVHLLYEFVAGNGFVVLLTDEQGCILEMTGDENIIGQNQPYGIAKGVFMSEESIGSNAISIALHENSPVQIGGQEHFVKVFHQWYCSAAAIHDEKGNTIGCINLSGYREKEFPYILGLVVSSAKAIEYQLKSSFSEMRQKETYNFVSQILNTLEFGVLATDINGKIRRANNLASGLLRTPIHKIENRNLEEFFVSWPHYLKKVKNHDIITDEEVQVNRPGIRESLNFNVYPLTDGDGTISGTVVTLRDMKRVYKMVNKYTGMQARYNFDDLIGESDEMKRIVEYCQNIADSPSTVLIQGESGTGKEVLAQSIHNYSSRREGGFVAINCGAIPESLIESELFGYTEGAFTSARKGGKPGKFELANGGTLFLDEIGEMPLDMQVKLLRALQERSITRVGGDKAISLDVRIIAATNRNLLEQVREGKFRQDLYYRLSVIPVYIPPLRNRREDIPMLISFFLNLKSVKLRKQLPDMDNKQFKKLISYNWPGNVRELENYIEKYVNLEGKLDWADAIMNPDIMQEALQPDANTRDSRLASESHLSQANQMEGKVISLGQMERIAIENALKVFNGNMTKVAAALGISRNALYQKIKKFAQQDSP